MPTAYHLPSPQPARGRNHAVASFCPHTTSPSLFTCMQSWTVLLEVCPSPVNTMLQLQATAGRAKSTSGHGPNGILALAPQTTLASSLGLEYIPVLCAQAFAHAVPSVWTAPSSEVQEAPLSPPSGLCIRLTCLVKSASPPHFPLVPPAAIDLHMPPGLLFQLAFQQTSTLLSTLCLCSGRGAPGGGPPVLRWGERLFAEWWHLPGVGDLPTILPQLA